MDWITRGTESIASALVVGTGEIGGVGVLYVEEEDMSWLLVCLCGGQTNVLIRINDFFYFFLFGFWGAWLSLLYLKPLVNVQMHKLVSLCETVGRASVCVFVLQSVSVVCNSGMCVWCFALYYRIKIASLYYKLERTCT